MTTISHNTLYCRLLRPRHTFILFASSFLSQRIEKCCWVYIFKKSYQFEHWTSFVSPVFSLTLVKRDQAGSLLFLSVFIDLIFMFLESGLLEIGALCKTSSDVLCASFVCVFLIIHCQMSIYFQSLQYYSYNVTETWHINSKRPEAWESEVYFLELPFLQVYQSNGTNRRLCALTVFPHCCTAYCFNSCAMDWNYKVTEGNKLPTLVL